MATYEHNALMQYIDETGNMHINYPATKAENVMMGDSDAQIEITARAKTSDVLYTLEEISACTDFTNKISGAEAVNEVNSNLDNVGSLVKLGSFNSTGDNKLLSESYENYRFILVCGSYYETYLPNYGQWFAPRIMAVSPFEFIHFYTIKGWVQFKIHDSTYIDIVEIGENKYIVVYGIK